MNERRSPILISNAKIWDQAPHNAFTDLIVFHDNLLCVFRESDNHETGNNGLIRIISSKEGVIWQSLAQLEMEGLDLRDPKLSQAPDGRLMLTFSGVTRDHKQKLVGWQSFVCFSNEGERWSEPTKILPKNEWLWRVTWHKGIAYGAAYTFSDFADANKEWYVSLWESPNGIEFSKVTDWDIPGRPNETTLRFNSEGDMVALLRNNRKPYRKCYVGISSPPYTQWIWNESQAYFSCPDFLLFPNDHYLAAGRMMYPCPYSFNIKVVIAAMNERAVKPIMIIPSQGDCGYPGMVFHKGLVWISYYSSVKDHSGIYLAKVLV